VIELEYWYIDDDRKPACATNVEELSRVFSSSSRGEWAKRVVLKKDRINRAEVSTVILPINITFTPGPLWETMVFGDERLSAFQNRCIGSIEQAESMHEEVCKLVRNFYET